uniref:T9SS C-terminal target domain-containing protein n=1 Tax=Flavobacterium daejeonense TaxID=350893 RepID=UPI00047D9483
IFTHAAGENLAYSVTDANGCAAATGTFSIVQPETLTVTTATIVNNNNCVGCSNGSINITVQGGTAPYSYTWSNGAITEDISGLPKGQYNVTISDKNSCSVTYTYYITESGIELLKDAVYVDSNNDGKTNIGDNIVYNFVVKNTGNVTLTNISITDNKATVTGGPIATLEAGASDSTTFTATHAITQDDINRGVFYNLALANAKDSENINVSDTSSDPTPCTTCTKDPECTDCTITVLPQTPELTVDKTAVVNTRDTTSDVYTFVGDVINYTITVTNTGNVSIYNVVVKDPLTGLDTTNEPFVLNPGESKEFTQSHTITLADLQVDSITNIATANGVTLGNTPVEAEDSVIVEKAGVLGCGTILVHNAFTPNNDGTNELFKIDNIDDTLCYPENSVEIYNRWGILVYETKGYNNADKSFKGFSEGRVTVDKSAGLPDGTYFYILNYTSVGLQGEITANKKQGYLYLTR